LRKTDPIITDTATKLAPVAGLSKIQFVANTAAMTGRDAEDTHNGNLQLSVGRKVTTFDTQQAM
jgi:hypothetical protein